MTGGTSADFSLAKFTECGLSARRPDGIEQNRRRQFSELDLERMQFEQDASAPIVNDRKNFRPWSVKEKVRVHTSSWTTPSDKYYEVGVGALCTADEAGVVTGSISDLDIILLGDDAGQDIDQQGRHFGKKYADSVQEGDPPATRMSRATIEFDDFVRAMERFLWLRNGPGGVHEIPGY